MYMNLYSETFIIKEGAKHMINKCIEAIFVPPAKHNGGITLSDVCLSLSPTSLSKLAQATQTPQTNSSNNLI